MITVSGVFDNNITADRVVSELLAEGFAKEDISLLMSDQTRDKLFSSTDDEATRSAKGALTGATIGGALGAIVAGLTMVGTILTNGGALLVTGPLVTALSGAGVGAVAGGLGGALIRAGFAADEANLFEEEIKRGKAVVIVHASDAAKATVARSVFKTAGAVSTKAA